MNVLRLSLPISSGSQLQHLSASFVLYYISHSEKFGDHKLTKYLLSFEAALKNVRSCVHIAGLKPEVAYITYVPTLI